jgi:CHAP domain-containing protein
MVPETPTVSWGMRVLATLSVVIALVLSATAVAAADPGNPWGGLPSPKAPKQPRTPQPSAPPAPAPAPPAPAPAPAPETPTPTPTASPTPAAPTPVGAPGTHLAHDVYGYGFPEAPNCDESTLSNCIADDRGFFQGQCTSWVAFRLSQRNGISFSNWYAGRHWGNASAWAKVAKGLDIATDKTPGVGSIAWFRRGHVAYVESVHGDGSITISEMNIDGANAFRLATLRPGDYGWPDKFIHVADASPHDDDDTRPSAPGRPRLVAHQGRVGLAWQRSSDDSGRVSYRVLRNGERIATTNRPAYWDRRVSPGQAYKYTVVAVDPAGNVSRAVRARLVPGAESADRAWVTTSAGPALCGRTGTPRRQRLTCTVLTERGWRRAPLRRTTDWGHAGSRHFVEVGDGDLAYCRTTGPARRPRASCTRLDATTLAWGRDVRSPRAVPLLARDRAWLPTAEGPTLCGRAGGQDRRRLGCAVLTEAGWRYSGLQRGTRWGVATSRAFLTDGRDTVSFCRTVTRDRGRRQLSCTPFYPASRQWGYDRISGPRASAGPVAGTWLSTDAGPALCGGGRLAATGCRVLGWTGWRFVPVRAAQGAGTVDDAFVAGTDGDVSWCRTVRAGAAYRAACSAFDSRRLRWSRDQKSAPRRLEGANRTWLATGAGPALCSRSGAPRRPGLGCQVLTADGWTWVDRSRGAAWGNPGYRAFLTVGDDVAYCRTVGRARVSCNRLDTTSLRWDRSATSRMTDWSYADPF